MQTAIGSLLLHQICLCWRWNSQLQWNSFRNTFKPPTIANSCKFGCTALCEHVDTCRKKFLVLFKLDWYYRCWYENICKYWHLSLSKGMLANDWLRLWKSCHTKRQLVPCSNSQLLLKDDWNCNDDEFHELEQKYGWNENVICHHGNVPEGSAQCSLTSMINVNFDAIFRCIYLFKDSVI